MARNRKATFGMVWSFRTKNFSVYLELEQDHRYRYDGDDEDGETQAKLDSGKFVAFDSTVTVVWDGHEIGSSSLGGSVYSYHDVAAFFTDHRCDDPNNRNTLAMKARNTSIGHYFPDMVREAIAEARQTLIKRRDDMPYIRESK